MPEVAASGDVFRLDAAAGFDEGVVRGKVGAGARATFDGRFRLCHGLDAAASGQVSAQVDAALGALWVLAGRGRGQAMAAAGAQVDARITVDLFDEFGLSAEVAAFAEASVAGRLAIGLDLQDLARLARQQLDDVAYDVFVAFINEVVIEAGVWAKASFAAMAKAHLNIRGSLRDDEAAGFTIEMGKEVAWGAGAGYEFFAGLRLTNPKRFYLAATERITRELVAHARAELPPHLHPATAMAELVLPVVLNAAYDLGQAVASRPVTSSGSLTAPFSDVFLAQLQRFVLDQLAQAGVRLLGAAVEETARLVAGTAIPAAQRDALAAQAEALVDQLRAGSSAGPVLLGSLGSVVDLLAALRPEEVERWRRPLAVTWAATAAAEALRHAVGTAEGSASASLVGLGTAATSAIVLGLPDPPAVVRDELDAFFDGSPPRIELRHVVDYLVGCGVAPHLHLVVPEVALVLERLSQGLGVTPGSLIEAVLHGTVGGDLTDTELYGVLRAFATEAIDGYIVADVLPELRARLGPGADALLWIDEVAEPSLVLARDFVFEQLDRLVTGGIAGPDLDPFVGTLRTGFSVLAGKVVVRNVVVVADVLVAHVMAGLHDAFRSLEGDLRSQPSHVMATAGATLVPDLLPPLVPVPADVVDATRELVAELAGAAADATGPLVLTAERRRRLRQLNIRLLLSVDGDVDPGGGAMADAFAQLLECAYISDPAGLIEINQLHLEILEAQLAAALPRVSDALGHFFLRLTAATVAELDEAARTFIDATAGAVQAAWDAFQAVRAEVERLVAEAQRAARELADRLDEAAVALRSPQLRRAVLDRLLADGIAAAEAGARAVIGFDLLPPDKQDEAVALAVGGFAVAFGVIRPALDAGLQALASVADDLGGLVDAAADVPDLMAAVVGAAGAAVCQGVEDALDLFGVAPPAELSVTDVAAAAEDAVSGLTALRLALEAALQASAAERDAKRRQRQAGQRRDEARARWQAEQDAHRAMLGQVTAVEITSPSPVVAAPGANWAYGPAVPVRIRVPGARPSFVQPGAPRRVFVAVNGFEVPIDPAAWSYSSRTGALSLRTTLSMPSMPLTRGLNVLECSVADGATTVVRQRVLFAVDPDAPLLGALEVDEVASTFDTPTDDHAETEREHVTFRNAGTAPVSLAGWQLSDRARHRFQFPDVEVLPGARVAVYTGPGVDTDAELHWGRSRASWNNRGDVVYLIDGDGTVRLEHPY